MAELFDSAQRSGFASPNAEALSAEMLKAFIVATSFGDLFLSADPEVKAFYRDLMFPESVYRNMFIDAGYSDEKVDALMDALAAPDMPKYKETVPPSGDAGGNFPVSNMAAKGEYYYKLLDVYNRDVFFKKHEQVIESIPYLDRLSCKQNVNLMEVMDEVLFPQLKLEAMNRLDKQGIHYDLPSKDPLVELDEVLEKLEARESVKLLGLNYDFSAIGSHLAQCKLDLFSNESEPGNLPNAGPLRVGQLPGAAKVRG